MIFSAKKILIRCKVKNDNISFDDSNENSRRQIGLLPWIDRIVYLMTLTTFVIGQSNVII